MGQIIYSRYGFSLIFAGLTQWAGLGYDGLIIVGLLLASWGGIKSVIATDVLQAGIFMIVPVILWSLWSSMQVDTSVMIAALEQREGGSAFQWFNGILGHQETTTDGFSWSTFLTENYSFGDPDRVAMAYFAVYGTDQDLAQRMLGSKWSHAARYWVVSVWV